MTCWRISSQKHARRWRLARRARLDTIFRFVHTVKGNCGFFDFPRLAALSHAAEDALSDCRSGRREADAALVTAVLAVIDQIVMMVDLIEEGTPLGEGGDEALIASLEVDAAPPASTSNSQAKTAPAEQAEQAEPQTSPHPPAVHEPASALLTDKGLGDESGDSSPPAAKKAEGVAHQRSIRLPVDLLDRVMSGVSDMVLARNDLAHRLRQAGTQPTIDGPFERLTTILADVRDAITRMRMQRIETLFGALPRLARDLSADLGKQVMVDLEGGDVELDREMIEMIRDPMTHIIRNAIDHGIEDPKVRLANGKREIGILSIAARQSGNTISIAVSDDGGGLDEGRIADKAVATGLITPDQRAQMASNISGRGVGLDVVRDNLEKVGGSIAVTSTLGVGTLFTLQIPLTLSIIAGLTVKCGAQRFTIPQSYIEEIIHASSKSLDFTRVGETALVTFRGERVPCLMLPEVLKLPASDVAEGQHTMVMLRLASGDMFALAVDDIHSHGDVVVKPLAPAVMKSGYFAGSTLLDDGEPVLLLDVTNIAGRYNLVSDARGRVRKAGDEAVEEQAKDINRVMLFTDFYGRRRAVRLELVQRIETAFADAIDMSGDAPRAIIDGAILPLIGLPAGPLTLDKVRLLRLTDGACELLHAVRDLDDAAELTHPLKPAGDDPLVEAITLVAGETVALLDGHEVFSRYGEAPVATIKPICRLPDTDWARTILGPLVTSAGYEIADSANCQEDVAIWFDDEYQAALSAEAASDAAPEARSDAPIIRLRDAPNAAEQDGSIYRYDRAGLIDALRTVRTAGGRI